MRSESNVEREFWCEKLYAMKTFCDKHIDSSLDKRKLNIADVAAEIKHLLCAKIPEQAVFIDVHITSLDVRVAVAEEKYVLFTSITKLCRYDAKVRMCLAYTGTRGYDTDIRSYRAAARQLINFYRNYASYQAELQGRLLEVQKESKLHQTAAASIRAVVEAKMGVTDYEWCLVEESERSILQIKMKRGKMIEITFGHKTFTDKIPELMTVITQMDTLLQGIPYPVNVRSYGRNIPWKRGGALQSRP